MTFEYKFLRNHGMYTNFGSDEFDHCEVFGDPDSQDPHVFGPPGSGSIRQRYGSGSRSFAFLINVLGGLK
jgi:hypothetical protein